MNIGTETKWQMTKNEWTNKEWIHWLSWQVYWLNWPFDELNWTVGLTYWEIYKIMQTVDLHVLTDWPTFLSNVAIGILRENCNGCFLLKLKGLPSLICSKTLPYTVNALGLFGKENGVTSICYCAVRHIDTTDLPFNGWVSPFCFFNLIMKTLHLL